MNILFINISKFYGGGEVYIKNLINTFSNNEHKLYLATPYVYKLINQVDKICNEIIITRSNVLPSIKDIFKLRKFIKKNKIDIIVFNGHDSVLFSPFLYSKKKIYINHSTFSENSFFKKVIISSIRKIIFSGIDKIIVLSQFNKNQFLNDKLCENSKLEIVFNGVNTNEFLGDFNIKKNDNNITICEVARLDKNKGQVDLVKAFNLAYPYFDFETELIFIGEGDDKENIENEIKKTKLNNIKVLGFSNEVNKILQNIDIFCLPSYTESFPLSILEAMASKKAIIATDVGGVSEIISNNENGLLVKPNDLEQLRDKLIYLVNNPEKARELGKQARITVESKFELKKSMKKTIKVILD